MPITSLEPYIHENRLACVAPIERFRNAVIGIDAAFYVRKLYEEQNEPLFLGVGGLLGALKHSLKANLSQMIENSIQPLFVFHGLSIDSTTSKLNAKEFSPKESHLELSWAKHSSLINTSNIYSGHNSNITFHKSLDELYPLVVNDLIHFFVTNSINYFISPYNASFQLSYFQEIGVVDAIMGSTDLLLTKTDRFILRFNFQSNEVKIIDKARLLGDLNLTERQFIDLAMIVGCALQPNTFPHLPQISVILTHQPSTIFRAALDLVHQYMAYTAINPSTLLGYVYGLHDQTLIELYLRGIAACEFMPIISDEGEVTLYLSELNKLKLPGKDNYLQFSLLPEVQNKQDVSDSARVAIPNDIHAVISQRLPPELFFYNSIGIIPSEFLESITTGSLLIRPPSSGSKCDRYKSLISSERSRLIMDMQFNVLTQLLTRYYQVKKIEVRFWFEDKAFQLNSRLIPPISSTLAELNVFNSQDRLFSFRKFWQLFPGVKVTEESQVLFSNGNLIMNALARSLFITGLIDRDMQESKLVRIFKIFTDRVPSISDDDLVLLFVLLQFLHQDGVDVLFKIEAFTPQELIGNTDKLTRDVIECVLAVSRVVSLVEVSFQKAPYRGPVSKDLLTFRNCLNVFREQLLVSLEVSLVDFVARKEVIKRNIKSKTDWAQLVLEIPFFRQLNNTLMGMLSEVFLKAALTKQIADAPLKLASAEAAAHVQSVFHFQENIFKDLEKSFSFWKSFALLMETAHEYDAGFVSKKHLVQIEQCSELVERFSPYLAEQL